MRRKRAVFLGHSLIEFGDWQEWFPELDVTSLGVAGETTQGLASRIESILKSYPEADFYVLMSGINNIAMDDFGFLESYRWIIRRLKKHSPESRIIVNSMLPCMVEFIDNKDIQSVNEELSGIADDEGAEFIDLYNAFVDGSGNVIHDYLLDDGVHLSEEGYRVWVEELRRVFQQH